jgi:sugar lactone lactonase YvrE
MLLNTAMMLGLINISLITLAQTDSLPSTYELPGESVYPEGIAYDEENNAFFVGSANDGTIFRGDIASGEITTFVEGGERSPFTTLGLKLDEQGQLWVAGGGSGQILVYDLATAEQVRTIDTPEAEATLLNDLVVASSGDVYATDSYRPILFKVTGEADTAEPWLDFSGTAFAYQEEGVNANGIEVTPDDEYLLVVQMNTGQLYRIEIASKEVTEVDLGGETLANGDGLVLDGQTLYVVLQQPDNEIVVIEMADDFTSGTVTSRIQDESLAAPATAIKVDDRLLVVNTQFDAMQSEEGPELPFTVSSIPLQ